MSAKRSPLAACAALFLALGCGRDVETQRAAPEAFCRVPAAEVEARIDALLAQMTPEEKVEQMHGRGDVGAINGLWYTPDNARLGIPGFRMVDGPRGVSQATGHATAFPVAIARGA